MEKRLERDTGATAPDVGNAEVGVQILRRLRSSLGAGPFLYDVVGLAAALVPSAASCAVTLQRDGEPVTAAVSDDIASRVDEMQLFEGDGPCLATIKTGTSVVIVDTKSDSRWEAFAAGAAGAGVRSVAAAPLMVDGAVLGSINLYGREPDEFASANDQLDLLADEAAYAYGNLLAQAQLNATNQQLVQALASRTVIDQAIGILMVQNRCTASNAFQMLREHSQRNNRKLRIVASDLVARVSGRPPDAPPGFRTGTETGPPAPDGASSDQLMITPLEEVPGVRLSGEADVAVERMLRESLAELFSRPPRAEDLSVDVGGLDFVDVSCLRLLVRAADLAHQRGARLVLQNPSAQFLRLLETSWGTPQAVHIGIGESA